MEPRKSRASTSRSRLAGGGEEQATASIPARATKSSRVCSKPGPAPQATARDKTGPKVEMWGDRSPKESSETYCSRMTARFTEYDQCGRKLRVAREEIRLARNLANKGAKKNRPDLKKRIDALKVEIKELEERRRIILEGSGLFKEKMENDGRFTTMKSSVNTVMTTEDCSDTVNNS